MNQSSENIRWLTVSAMLTALAYACVALSSMVFPIKIEGFLSLECKDAVLMIGAFLFGPGTGLAMAAVVAVLEFLTFSGTGWIGLLMNVLSSALFICPAAAVYRRRRTFGGALIGLGCGAAAMCAGMILWNYVMTPIYMGVAREMVVGMLLPVILPFNLLKAALNGALTMLLYHAVVTVLRKAHLLPPSDSAPARRGRSVWVAGIALVCAAGLLLAALAWSGAL